jgi:predicted Zn-dependent protease
MSDQARMTPWLVGAMILGMLAAGKSAQGAQAMIVGGQAVAAQSQLNFSRDMEREADRIGYSVLAEAGFDTYGFVTMFGKLQQASGLNDHGGFPYLRSHPLTTERIADMQSRQQLLNNKTNNLNADLIQAMMSARARTLAQPGVDALRSWANEASDPNLGQLSQSKRLGVLYGAYMSLMQLRDFNKAKALSTQLRQAAANHPAALRLIQLLEAELAFKEEDIRGALKLLSSSASQGVWPRPELIYISQAVSRSHAQTPDAESAELLGQTILKLQRWVVQHPLDAQAWQVLATALSAQGRLLASLRSEGEAQLARWDIGAAVDRFRAAQDTSRKLPSHLRDHIEASIVDARLRHAQGLLIEQMKERQERGN